MPKVEPNYIPYYPCAPERHIFSPDRSISPELRSLSGSLQHSLCVGDASSGHNGPPKSENNVSDSKVDCGRTLTDSRSSPPSIFTRVSKLFVGEDLIPKPKGSLGKPGSGGYSLRKALGWDTEEYRATQAYIQSLAQEHLDGSIAFSAQNPKVIAELCRKADIKYPRLKSYKDRWATKDFLASYHKRSTSGTRPKSRQKGHRKPPSGGAQRGASSSKAKSVTFEDQDSQLAARRLRSSGRVADHIEA